MKKRPLFGRNDVKQIKSLGLKASSIQRQLACYKKKPYYLSLAAPCTVNDGIRKISPRQKNNFIAYYEKESRKYRVIKFVPSSGAASRMFASWFFAEQAGGFGSDYANKQFFKSLKKMPFFPLLENNQTFQKYFNEKNISSLLRVILHSEGVNLGELPKALIPFHLYANKEMRTALEEHIYEAAGYIADAKNICRLHITVSPEHRPIVARKLRQFRKKYEKICAVQYKYRLSVQSPSTSIIAVDEKDNPLRDNRGRLVFRPGGHGALLENLNVVDADLIFVKNIDNVAPSNVTKNIIPYRKMLGGVAIDLMRKVHKTLGELSARDIDAEELNQIADFCRQEVNACLPKGFEFLKPAQKKKILFDALNRPLRVCAMVKNTGEPGGGPFWIKEKNGAESPQIVELAHVNKSDSAQMEIWSRATHFNPVDMVCCIKDYRGRKYNLKEYVDKNSYLVTTKMEKGRKIKALEMPGLWNGGMARWNTIFIEIPLMAFNPVKIVEDLLRPQHLASRKIN